MLERADEPEFIEQSIHVLPGAIHIGERYLSTAYPYAFLLLVIGDMRFDWRVIALGLIGIAINVMGAYEVWTNVLLRL